MESFQFGEKSKVVGDAGEERHKTRSVPAVVRDVDAGDRVQKLESLNKDDGSMLDGIERYRVQPRRPLEESKHLHDRRRRKKSKIWRVLSVLV